MQQNYITRPVQQRQSFSTDLSDLPEVSQAYNFEYLVEKECVYTREALKAYRTLDAYNKYKRYLLNL